MNKRSFIKAISGLLAALGSGVKAKETPMPEYVIVPGFAPMDGRPLTFNGVTYVGRAPYMMLPLGERGGGKEI